MIKVLILPLIIGFAQLELSVQNNKHETSSILNEYFVKWGEIIIQNNSIDPFNEPIDSLTKDHILSLMERPTKRKLKRNIKDLLYYINSLQPNEINKLKLHWNNSKKNIIHNNIGYPVLNISIEDKLYAICQYWNTIRFFYPHYNSIKDSWNNHLEEIISKILTNDSNLTYHLAIAEMASLTSDGHAQIKSSVLDNYWGYFHLPMKLGIYNGRLFIHSIDTTSLITSTTKQCPELIAINDVSFREFYHKNQKLVAGANERTKVRLASSLFIRQQQSMNCSIKLALAMDTVIFKMNNRHLSNKSNFEEDNKEPSTGAGPVGDSIYYFDLTSCSKEIFIKNMNYALNYEAIILDLRGYPTVLLDDIADYLVGDTIRIAQWKHPNKDHIGDFTFGPELTISGNPSTPKYYGKVFLLVNNKTWSQAEFTALAIQTIPNAQTIGCNTSGTDGDISEVHLAGGIYTQYTSLDILNIDKTPTYKTGINIDIPIQLNQKCKMNWDGELEICIDTIGFILK